MLSSLSLRATPDMRLLYCYTQKLHLIAHKAGPQQPSSSLPCALPSSKITPSSHLLVTAPVETREDSGSATIARDYSCKGAKTSAKLVDTLGNDFEVPDFTTAELRAAIPKHCFERSAIRGLYYVARDLASLFATFYLFRHLNTSHNIPSTSIRFVLWAGYTFLQGLFGTGLWILAHECGHQSFSSSKRLNDTVGLICHSVLLVPYFSWKITHKKHHASTGNLERDMAFMPHTRETYSTRHGYLRHQLHELAEDTPLSTLGELLVQQLGGWPIYLLTNATGHDNHKMHREGRGTKSDGTIKRNGLLDGVNHFNPHSPLFDNKDFMSIVITDMALLVVVALLIEVGRSFGWMNLFVWYFVPWLWVHHWLVAITFLHHTDPTLPHYSPETWTYTKGAAATIDRDFGIIGRHFFHGIIETHVLHHFISAIPFYHADEATEAIKPVMGRHYRSDTRRGSIGFLQSLWKNIRSCQWVEPLEGATGDDAGVHFYRNKNGIGMRPAKCEPETRLL